MAIVPVPMYVKWHAHNYIPKILGGGGPQTLLVSLLLISWFILLTFSHIGVWGWCGDRGHNLYTFLCEGRAF